MNSTFKSWATIGTCERTAPLVAALQRWPDGFVWAFRGDSITPTGSPTRNRGLAFELKNAKLYSFWIE